ncbi:MAG: hypothetical protein LW854_19485 [Rubrivivax sp.]|jgi:hypothetical protein|nr:hypothetical protein [Rubrivivax sp.]
MDSLRKSLRERMSELADKLEAQRPHTTQKLLELGRTAKGLAGAAYDTAKEAAVEVHATAQRVADDPRAHNLVDGASVRLSAARAAVGETVSSVRQRLKAGDEPHKPVRDDEASHLTRTIDAMHGRDRVGVSAEAAAVAGGAAAGVAASGAIAGAFGATTLLGSSTLASALGGVFVTTTPVGWVIGSAALMGAAGYGVARLIRSGAEQDRARLEIMGRLSERLGALQTTAAEPVDELAQLVSVCMVSQLISDEQGQQLVGLVERGALDASLAVMRLRALAVESGVIELVSTTDTESKSARGLLGSKPS